MNKTEYKKALKLSLNNKTLVLESKKCGCFYCIAIFPTEMIEKWSDKKEGETDQTAICPYCASQSIIGDASGYDITLPFLQDMYDTRLMQIKRAAANLNQD